MTETRARPKRRRPWPIAKWRRRYEAGETVRQIVASGEGSMQTVWQGLQDAGTVMRPSGRPRKAREPADA